MIGVGRFFASGVLMRCSSATCRAAFYIRWPTRIPDLTVSVSVFKNGDARREPDKGDTLLQDSDVTRKMKNLESGSGGRGSDRPEHAGHALRLPSAWFRHEPVPAVRFRRVRHSSSGATHKEWTL
jgi:hypothetical protein